jgi:sugar phosphate isomerase/epimerase
MAPAEPLPANSFSRRNLLLAGAVLAVPRPALSGSEPPQPSSSGLKIAIFSKHLQFLRGEDLAKGAAEIGFDGIDIAVRKGGHVEPAAASQELPKLVGIIRAHGLQVPMITTDIVDDTSPYAEAVLQAASELGIRHYRWGGLKYNNQGALASQLDAMKPRVAKLASLNKRYGVCAMYHTHSGIGVVGAPIWDLHILLTDFDPNSVAVNYDVGHATVEGGFGGWIDSFRVTGPYLKGIAVKDFLWKKDESGEWTAAWQPLGEGMVHFHQFFAMVKEARFSGPLQLHFEYPLGGANSGKTTLSIPREKVFAAMKQDVTQLRGYLDKAGLSA